MSTCHRRRSVYALLAALLLAGPAGAAPPDEGTVQAQLVWEPGLIGTYTPGRIPFRDDPPPGVAPLQDLTSPRYARIVMAGTKGLTVALDAEPESPRLFVDSDFDGDLSDEKRIWLKRTGATFSRTQSVLLRYEGDAEPTSIDLTFRYTPSQGSDYVQVWANVHRRGTVVLGGRLRLIALVDGRADLRFDDPKKDRLFIDLDGNGRFAVTGDAAERVPFDTPFRAGSEGWIARKADRSGRHVEFVRADVVPPAKPRSWPRPARPTAGMTRTPPKASFKALSKKFVGERNKPYASRYQTVNEIGFVGTDEAFEFLLKRAEKDKDKNLRAAAVRAMGNKAYLSVGGDRVMALMRDAIPTIQNAAAQALHSMGHPDRETAYLNLLRTESNVGALSNAARFLAAFETEATRKAILDAYAKQGAPNTKYTLYFNGLRMLKTGPPVQEMLDAAASSYAPLQGYALTDLHVIGHARAPEIAFRLASIRPVALQVGTAVTQVLGAHGGGKAVRALLSLFEDPKLHANVQKAIAEQLRFLRDPESITALVLSLKAKSDVVRRMAAEILAAIPDPAVTAALLKCAKKEKDPVTLAALLEALGDHGDPSAIGLLLKQAKKRRSKDDTRDVGRRAAIRSLARIGFEHVKVRKFLLGLLGARADLDRILALNAAGASGDARLVPRIAPSLRHDTWQVRLTAIRALGRIRATASIPVLIEALEREEEPRLRDALAQALFVLTGQNLYDNAAIWKDWWAKNKETFEVPKRAPEMPEDHAGPTQAGFYGIPVRTRRVVFVIDQSGSMQAPGDVGSNSDKDDDLNRLDVAVREVLRAIERLEDRARVNVIFFHSTIHPWQDGMRKLGKSNRNALRSHLVKQQPTGGTNLFDGLEQGLLTKDVDTVFLLSDGVPGAGKYIATPDILRAVRRINQARQVAIHCVSIGVDSDLLKQLAKQHGGRYVRK